MYSRVLSKAYGWMAMRLYVLAEWVMRQSGEVSGQSRDNEKLFSAAEGLPGSPPAHWLEMVRRQAPELYRSVVSRRMTAAGRAAIPDSEDGNAVNETARSAPDTRSALDTRSTSDKRDGMPLSPLRTETTPASPAAEKRPRNTWLAEQRQAPLAESSNLASVKVPEAKGVVPPQRPARAMSRSTPHQGKTERVLPLHPVQARGYGETVSSPPSRQDPAAEACRPGEERPRFAHWERTSPTESNPPHRQVQQPGKEALRHVAERPAVGVVEAAAQAAAEFPDGFHQTADTPIQTSRVRPTVGIPDAIESPASARYGPRSQPLPPQEQVPGDAGLRRVQVPASRDLQSLESPRWASLPDPVEAVGTAMRWAALPDDGWTQPQRDAAIGGTRAGDALDGTDGYAFKGRSAGLWNG